MRTSWIHATKSTGARAAIAGAIAAAFFLTGCNGPTKAGREARAAANDRMNLVSAQVNYDQAR